MSCLKVIQSQSDLTPERAALVCEQLKSVLRGRVLEAYLFGSVSLGTFHKDSDLDLILVVEGPLPLFHQRALMFADIYEIYPRMDLLVYTPQELTDQLADSAHGFWRSVRESMRKIV